MTFLSQAVILSLASLASAYGPPWGGGGGGGGWGGRGGPWGGGRGPFGDDGSSPFSSDAAMTEFINRRQKIIIAHGVLAALAFVILFPVGSIMIRLGSFRGAWLVHGLFQLFAYVIYTVAFGIGIWVVNNTPGSLINHYHPSIGVAVFVFLFIQPILGLIHHHKFKKVSRRTFWSYAHLWVGRLAVTLGIINGGLGFAFAKETGMFVPTQGQIIAYSVIAGVMWLLWVAAAVVGERRRSKAQREAPVAPKHMDDSDSEHHRDASPPPYKEHYAHRAA